MAYRKPSSIRASVALVAVAWVAATCGGDGATRPQPVPNRSPVTVGTIPAQEVSAGQPVTVDVSAYFSDPNSDGLSYTAASSDAEVATASVSGSMVTVTGVTAGAVTVTVTARDPGGLSVQQSFAVTVPNPALALAWAADFVARQHVVDGAIGYHVRTDPDCIADCEHAIYPGIGPRDLETVKAVTGIDMGLSSISSGLATMTWHRDRIDDGRIANARVVRTYADIGIAHGNGDYAVMFYVQRRPAPAWQLGGDVTTLRRWYDEGLRVLQLAYGIGREDARGPNERLGYGGSEGDDGGVTDLGRLAIAEMNRLGMIVDVSHTNKQTTLDAAALSTMPVIATHANAEALNRNHRNKSDQELIAIAATGGVIGVTPIRHFLDTNGDGVAGMDDMIAHIEYIVSLVGIDHVGIATDAWMDGWEQSSGFYTDADLAALDRWVRLTARLHARGWSEEDLAKLLGGNFLRVFAEIL